MGHCSAAPPLTSPPLGADAPRRPLSTQMERGQAERREAGGEVTARHPLRLCDSEAPKPQVRAKPVRMGHCSAAPWFTSPPLGADAPRRPLSTQMERGQAERRAAGGEVTARHPLRLCGSEASETPDRLASNRSKAYTWERTATREQPRSPVTGLCQCQAVRSVRRHPCPLPGCTAPRVKTLAAGWFCCFEAPIPIGHGRATVQPAVGGSGPKKERVS